MRIRLIQQSRTFQKFFSRPGSSQANHRQSKDVFKLSEEVESALHSGKPVVALETTIITHGMPYPDNLKTALEVEQIVRDGGAVAATVGILNGKIHVGLEKSQIEFLADPKTSAVKTSRRDLPYVLSQGLHGGTTVSGTMVAAHMAGISIFVTGGIGGVHRGAEASMDVSADLTELGRTPVAVISAGVKSILDIGRTLEYLETEGVNVVSYGSSREFPAFFSRKSGFQAPFNVETAAQAARIIYTSQCLGLQSGSLVAVPIPEEFDVLGQEIESVIQSVVMEAERAGVRGKEVTPYILGRVTQLTEGKSLEANKHLIRNNAKVGTEISVELSRLHKIKSSAHGDQNPSPIFKRHYSTNVRKTVCVVGGSIVDFTARISSPTFQMNGGTYPGSMHQSYGGVGRNIADGLTRLGVCTTFISAIGDDSHRKIFETYCAHMDLGCVARIPGHNTATYCAILKENGQLLLGIGDMDIHAQITPHYISQFAEKLKMSALVCIDGNLSVEAMEYVCTLCANHGIPVLFEPADMHKASKPFLSTAYKAVVYASPNLNELRLIVSHLSGKPVPTSVSAEELSLDDVLHECTKLLKVVTNYIPVTMLTIGKHGVVLCYHGDRHGRLPLAGDVVQREGNVIMEHYSTKNISPESIVSVSGAGDCMVAAFIWKLLEGQDPTSCIQAGLLAGHLSLMSSMAVPPSLTPHALSGEVIEQCVDVSGAS